MNASVEILELEASRLPIDDRFELVEKILARIDGADPEIDAAWLAEVQGRLTAWRNGDLTSRPAAEVFAKHIKP